MIVVFAQLPVYTYVANLIGEWWVVAAEEVAGWGCQSAPRPASPPPSRPRLPHDLASLLLPRMHVALSFCVGLPLLPIPRALVSRGEGSSCCTCDLCDCIPHWVTLLYFAFAFTPMRVCRCVKTCMCACVHACVCEQATSEL